MARERSPESSVTAPPHNKYPLPPSALMEAAPDVSDVCDIEVTAKELWARGRERNLAARRVITSRKRVFEWRGRPSAAGGAYPRPVQSRMDIDLPKFAKRCARRRCHCHACKNEEDNAKYARIRLFREVTRITRKCTSSSATAVAVSALVHA